MRLNWIGLFRNGKARAFHPESRAAANDLIAIKTNSRQTSAINNCMITAAENVSSPSLEISLPAGIMNPINAVVADACIRCLRAPSRKAAAAPKTASNIPNTAGISAVMLALPVAMP